MAFPWFCGHCSVWQPAQYQLCPGCGRSRTRLCRKCRKPVPAHALCCPACGGDGFLEPAARPVPLSRPQKVSLGLLALGVLVVAVALLPGLLSWLIGQALGLAIQVGIWVGAFLLLTGLFPERVRGSLRRGTWGTLRGLLRLIGNMFR